MRFAHPSGIIRTLTLYNAIHNIAPQNKYILDAGCGNGGITFSLANEYKDSQFVGVDINPNNINVAKSRMLKNPSINNVAFINGDLASFRCSKPVDIIYCIDVLEHIEDDVNVFNNFSRNLIDGGKLIIHVPSSPQRSFFNIDVNPQSDHVREGYKKDDIISKLIMAGLKMEMITYTFGTFGQLAWFIHGLFRSVTFFFLWPIIYPLVWFLAYLDLINTNVKGNGLFIISIKQ